MKLRQYWMKCMYPVNFPGKQVVLVKAEKVDLEHILPEPWSD